MSPRLICTDLERTLLPDRRRRESPDARERLFRLAAASGIELVYLTPGPIAHVQDAIREHRLAPPLLAICDNGTSIYEQADARWTELTSWWEKLAAEWPESDRIIDLLANVPGLSAQEAEKQTPFKLAWYAPRLSDPAAFLGRIQQRIRDVTARLVYRVEGDTGLLDVIPLAAGQLAAIEHVIAHLGTDRDETLYAGHDPDVHASPIPSVLVADATAAARRKVVDRCERMGTRSRLCVAEGALGDVNGFGAGGILEGLVCFWPELSATLATDPA